MCIALKTLLCKHLIAPCHFLYMGIYFILFFFAPGFKLFVFPFLFEFNYFWEAVTF